MKLEPLERRRARARLNDVVCVCVGEVRAREHDESPDLVLDVAELVWEPIAE